MAIASTSMISDCFDLVEDPEFLVLRPRTDCPLLVFDPGLASVATCQSEISRIDGTNGVLFYRGRSINDLLPDDCFLSVAYDLIEGDSDSSLSRAAFIKAANRHLRLLPELKRVLDAMAVDSHPMDILAAGILATAGFEVAHLGKDVSLIERAAFIIAQTQVIGAYHLSRLQGREWREFDDESRPFAHRVMARLSANHDNLAERARVLNSLLILHAEHDQNCSTATVRNVASAGSDMYAAIAAGICAFKGRLHGGASQAVAAMYDDILKSNADPRAYVASKIATKERLMGFGHRVYRCWDPRAKYMFDLLSADDNMFGSVADYRSVALSLITAAENSEFFRNRGVYPNPDLLNSILFKWLGAPPSMNAVMLSMSRVAGWIAHYAEQQRDGLPIVRPRQLTRLRAAGI
jgi:citrate synthase